MNTVNHSTGFTPFQLRFGKSPRILPLILENDTSDDNPAADTAWEHLAQMLPLELEAKDNLLTAKINQAQSQNRHRQHNFPFRTGDRALLSMEHCRAEYKSKDTKCVAKFMPRFDGPYKILSTNEKHSTVTLDLPNAPHTFPIFHASELMPFKENDNTQFPTHAKKPPESVIINNEQEFFIDKIVDERCKNKTTQYLVRWQGEGLEGDKWLPANELEDCEVLDKWLVLKPRLPRLVVRY
jgi:hypothetical protein